MVAGVAQHSIFISRRLDDSADVSMRVYDRLRAAFGADAILNGVRDAKTGAELGAHLRAVLPRCQFVLAMIGPCWNEVRKGARRLDSPEDSVRMELEIALGAPNVQVIPVLVNETRMIRPEHLPQSLQKLAGLSVADVRRDPNFHKDMDRLIRVIEGFGQRGVLDSTYRQTPRSSAALESVQFPENACPEMVRISPGKFLMGATTDERGSSDNERPQHEVRIDYAFELSKYPVTSAQWDQALAAGAKLERLNRGWGRDKQPVVYVSWRDAQAYLAFLNDICGLAGRDDAYRLPSEAEWEYACRAGTTTSYWTGDSITASQACISRKLLAVGSHSANAFGLHDMTGNVWEWCEDVWHDNYHGAPSDGSAWVMNSSDVQRRVRRGGCWSGYVSQDLRSASRSGIDLADRNFDQSLRVARTVFRPKP